MFRCYSACPQVNALRKLVRNTHPRYTHMPYFTHLVARQGEEGITAPRLSYT